MPVLDIQNFLLRFLKCRKLLLSNFRTRFTGREILLTIANKRISDGTIKSKTNTDAKQLIGSGLNEVVKGLAPSVEGCENRGKSLRVLSCHQPID